MGSAYFKDIGYGQDIDIECLFTHMWFAQTGFAGTGNLKKMTRYYLTLINVDEPHITHAFISTYDAWLQRPGFDFP